MTTIKIADLPVATSVADIAVLPVVQGDITQQATKTTFLTGVTLTNPNIGTPSAGTLTNCIGLPIDGGTFGTLPANRGGTGITSLGANIATFLQTPSSANLAAALTDETGTGANVFATSPTLVTPTLGVATATSINKVAITAPATSATLTVANGKTLTANSSLTLAGVDAKTLTVNNSLTLAGVDAKTLTVNNSLTLAGVDAKTLTVNNSLALAGTDGTTMTFPSTSATIARTDAAQSFTGAQTFAGPIVAGSVQALSGPGAVNITALTTAFTSTGTGDALTLANGAEGQIKTIVYVAEAAGADTGVLTPTTPLGYATITFTDIGDSVTLQYFTQGWAVIGVNGATVA
jgi:hypothetical protein